MKRRILYVIWGVLYALCATLGFVAEPSEALQVAMTLFSLAFFVPGVLLLVDSLRKKDRKGILTIRIISALSLGLTTAMYIANLLSVTASDAVGTGLYYALLLVSSPMVSMGVEMLSLFLWACLLFGTFTARNQK